MTLQIDRGSGSLHVILLGMARKILYMDLDNTLVDFLVDDRPNNGADRFAGEWIHFGFDRFLRTVAHHRCSTWQVT